MLKIHLKTGTAWTKPIKVEGSLMDDIGQLIDDYYLEYGLPVALYTLDELDDEELEEMLPIIGGEYYIEGIEFIEEVAIVDRMKQLDHLIEILGVNETLNALARAMSDDEMDANSIITLLHTINDVINHLEYLRQ